MIKQFVEPYAAYADYESIATQLGHVTFFLKMPVNKVVAHPLKSPGSPNPTAPIRSVPQEFRRSPLTAQSRSARRMEFDRDHGLA